MERIDCRHKLAGLALLITAPIAIGAQFLPPVPAKPSTLSDPHYDCALVVRTAYWMEHKYPGYRPTQSERHDIDTAKQNLHSHGCSTSDLD